MRLNQARRVRAFVAGALSSLLLLSGLAILAPATATAAPCTKLSTGIIEGYGTVEYKIKNSCDTKKRRKIIINNGADSDCITIKANSTKRGEIYLGPFAYPEGLESC